MVEIPDLLSVGKAMLRRGDEDQRTEMRIQIVIRRAQPALASISQAAHRFVAESVMMARAHAGCRRAGAGLHTYAAGYPAHPRRQEGGNRQDGQQSARYLHDLLVTAPDPYCTRFFRCQRGVLTPRPCYVSVVGAHGGAAMSRVRPIRRVATICPARRRRCSIAAQDARMAS